MYQVNSDYHCGCVEGTDHQAPTSSSAGECRAEATLPGGNDSPGTEKVQKYCHFLSDCIVLYSTLD